MEISVTKVKSSTTPRATVMHTHAMAFQVSFQWSLRRALGQNLHGRERELEVQRGACDSAHFIPGLPKKAETYLSAKYLEETPALQVHPLRAAGLWVSCPEEHT